MGQVLLLRIVLAFLFFAAAWLCGLYVTGFFQKKSLPRRKPRKNPPKSPKKMKTIPRKATIVNVTLGNSDSNSDHEAIMVQQLLLSASIHLAEVHIDPQAMEGVTDSYAGVMGDFCELNFSAQKQDPTSVPMFRHLVQHSPACKEKRYRVSIKDFAELARKHDMQSDASSKALTLGGVIFHESRCGSTMIANALLAMSPQQHRVYSEAQPEMAANLCGDNFQYCSKEQAAELLRDVIYIMSRTGSDSEEERLFVKFHSDNTRNLEVFQHAFPDTPWLFVYRNPVHVIVSQFKEGKSISKCVRGMKDPSPQVVEILRSEGLLASPSREVFCAATLASYCKSALNAKERAPQLGTFVHYPDLPQVLTDDIFPNKFGLALTDEHVERIQSISTMYSKASHGRSRPYRDDSDDKQRKVTPAIQQAANIFLQDSYQQLQNGDKVQRTTIAAGDKVVSGEGAAAEL